MDNIKKYFDTLGYKVEDKVTGFKGVVTSISFDLYGCIQSAVDPGLDNDGKTMASRWFDIARLKITSEKLVMDQPDFDIARSISEGKKGAAEKPIHG